VTNFIVDDLQRALDRTKRDYASLRHSVHDLYYSAKRAFTHARDANDMLGTEGFLAYFEPPELQSPDAIDLLNRLAEDFNAAMVPPEEHAPVSLPV
jgi:hypothetical protein